MCFFAGSGGGGVVFAGQGDGGGAGAAGVQGIDLRAVGHFEHVGHVGAGTDIEDSVLVAQGFKDIEHAGTEYAGVDGPGFAGFQVDLHMVHLADFAQEVDEGRAVVVRFGNPVAAAEVQVADLGAGQQTAELFFKGAEGIDELPRPLLAKGVEVQAGDAAEVCALQLVGGDAEARARHAGVVQGGVAGGKAGVDAQPQLQLAALYARVGEAELAPALPLGYAVEVDVVGKLQQLGQFCFPVGWGIGGYMPAQMPGTQARFIQAGGAAACGVWLERAQTCRGGKGLEGHQHVRAGGLGYLLQQAGVALQCGE